MASKKLEPFPLYMSFKPLFILSLLLVGQALSSLVYSQESKSAETRVKQFYDYLQNKAFEDTWKMLSTTSAKLEPQNRYAARLAKSTRNLNLESAKTTSFRFFKNSESYAEVATELTFVLEKTKEKYNSRHFTLWILENGEWRLDDERSLESGIQISQLQPWELTREKAVLRVAVGMIESLAEAKVEILWLADEKYGNPYLRIGAEGGIFQKNRIDLKIRDVEAGAPRVLSEILSKGTQLANINLSELHKRQILTNVRLVSFSSGIYANVLSSSPGIVNLRDLSGKTVGTAGFSDPQIDLIKDRLRTELGPKFSGVTIVNAKDSDPSELNNILEGANAEVFLLHPTSTQSFGGRQYRYITNIKQPASAIFMTEELLRQKPAVAERFLLSLLESIEYFRKNRAAVIVYLMERSPDLKISEAARLYEKHLRELPTRADDFFPTARDIKLFTPEVQISGPGRLETIIEPRFIKNMETKAAMPQSFQ